MAKTNDLGYNFRTPKNGQILTGSKKKPNSTKTEAYRNVGYPLVNVYIAIENGYL